ncbi:MAG: hypothetical protein QOF85_950 [Solirubrobacterales bacterium]|nr:hypothetical protein [Solirubrobacterales bacterium]
MEEIAKLLVLAVLAALLIAFIKQGPKGPKSWWRSKFLGEASE